MAVTPAEYAAIKADLANGHYAAMLALPTVDQQNAAIAADLNITPSWNAGDSVFRRSVNRVEILDSIVAADYGTLSATQQNFLALLLTESILDVSKSNVRATLGGLFGVGTTTRTNLVALASKTCSRLEKVLNRDGATIEPWEVARARAS